jgi:CspA family cold shock protein
MTEGTVKFFHAEKQFGFINGDDGKSYYFHATQVEHGTRLTDGDKVSFTPVQGDRGPKAEKVKKVVKAEKAAEEPAGDEEPAEEEEIEEDE